MLSKIPNNPRPSNATTMSEGSCQGRHKIVDNTIELEEFWQTNIITQHLL